MSRGPDHLEPGEALRQSRTAPSRLQPGRYRYYVEFKAIDGTQANEEYVEFTVTPASSGGTLSEDPQQVRSVPQSPTSLSADLAIAGLDRITIESAYHHLGDNRSSTAYNPDPEGIRWSKTFSLDHVPPGTAYVTLEVSNINAADLVINGCRLAVPAGHSPRTTAPPVWRSHLLPLPSGLFRVGANQIALESIWLPDLKTYDDFQFGKLAVSFERPRR